MLELPVIVYEQNNTKGIVIVFTTVLLVVACSSTMVGAVFD